ncbi:unnamed protein product [Arctia plantaginis]|uniref:Uncharacterized protein n=1 Tax=Arctia plantaginis TaxID=874455 RepID=A0A8S1B8P9_ARCPL|nr:unnamed protein product [Arctia plantaginis]
MLDEDYALTMGLRLGRSSAARPRTQSTHTDGIKPRLPYMLEVPPIRVTHHLTLYAVDRVDLSLPPERNFQHSISRLSASRSSRGNRKQREFERKTFR